MLKARVHTAVADLSLKKNTMYVRQTKQKKFNHRSKHQTEDKLPSYAVKILQRPTLFNLS